MEPMYVVGEKGGNILSYVDFSKICNVIKSFPGLSKNIGREDITFLLSSTSRTIEWRNEYIITLESYADQIDTGLCIDFKINKGYLKDFFSLMLNIGKKIHMMSYLDKIYTVEGCFCHLVSTVT